MASVAANPEGDDPGEPLDKPLARKIPPNYPTGTPPSYPGPQRSGPTPTGIKHASGYFTIYKKGQGFWTRIGTVMGAALVGLMACDFLWSEHTNFHLQSRGGYILIAAFAALYCLLAFHLMNRPGHVDFLVATDSEMKKVNWTSREALMGSTRVVIIFMLAVALILFLYDMFFQWLFYLIGVLSVPPPFMKGK